MGVCGCVDGFRLTVSNCKIKKETGWIVTSMELCFVLERVVWDEEFEQSRKEKRRKWEGTGT